MSTIRIPLYKAKDVEVHLCATNGKISLEISNSSEFPRMIALGDKSSDLIQVGAHCLRKLPWSLKEHPALHDMEVKVSDNVEDTLRMTRAMT